MTDHGFIALGKFSSARDSILEYLCSNGWATESFGDVEAPTGYVYRISNTIGDVNKRNGEFNSIMGDWFEQNPEVRDSVALRQELVGHFIVTENSQGFVNVTEIATANELAREFDRMAGEFETWAGLDDLDDEDEYEPIYKVTSNGTLQQMEVHGTPTNYYTIDDQAVWAVNEETARVIARMHEEASE
jgi:hypothetical protein